MPSRYREAPPCKFSRRLPGEYDGEVESRVRRQSTNGGWEFLPFGREEKSGLDLIKAAGR